MSNDFEQGINESKVLSDDDKKDVFRAAQAAQELANHIGLKIGQTVMHKSDVIAYALKEIKGDVGVVWLPGKEDTVKEFPLNELYDPNIVIKTVLRNKFNEVLKYLPGSNN